MHNAAVAEWILSLVVAPDRAASTVGDLVEEATSRGTLWFWSCVLRTAGSHLWHELTVSPLRMFGLAFWGVGATWLFSGVLGLPLVVVGMRINELARPWEITYVVLACTVAGLLAGWKVARRSPGRELPAAFAVAALFAAIYLVGLCLSSSTAKDLIVCCLPALSVIVGAVLFRRRRHKTSYSPACR
jgi:hypothetical protein